MDWQDLLTQIGGLDELREELRRRTVTVASPKGELVLTLNGCQEIREVRLKPGLVPDARRRELEEEITGALAEGLRRARQLAVELLLGTGNKG